MKVNNNYIAYTALAIIVILAYATISSFAVTRVRLELKQTEDVLASTPKNHMNSDHALSVLEVVNAQGFDEAFMHYSSYKDIPDTRFHELRRAYLQASTELKNYLHEAAHIKVETPHYLRNY